MNIKIKNMKSNEFKCAICGKLMKFTALEEEQALQELKDNFGDVKVEDCGIVCDDCYKKVMPSICN